MPLHMFCESWKPLSDIADLVGVVSTGVSVSGCAKPQ